MLQDCGELSVLQPAGNSHLQDGGGPGGLCGRQAARRQRQAHGQVNKVINGSAFYHNSS